MTTVLEIETLKQEIETLKRKSAEAKGAIEQIRKESDLGPLATAECLAKLQIERSELEYQFEKKKEEYKGKYFTLFGEPVDD